MSSESCKEAARYPQVLLEGLQADKMSALSKYAQGYADMTMQPLLAREDDQFWTYSLAGAHVPEAELDQRMMLFVLLYQHKEESLQASVQAGKLTQEEADRELRRLTESSAEVSHSLAGLQLSDAPEMLTPGDLRKLEERVQALAAGEVLASLPLMELQALVVEVMDETSSIAKDRQKLDDLGLGLPMLYSCIPADSAHKEYLDSLAKELQYRAQQRQLEAKAQAAAAAKAAASQASTSASEGASATAESATAAALATPEDNAVPESDSSEEKQAHTLDVCAVLRASFMEGGSGLVPKTRGAGAKKDQAVAEQDRLDDYRLQSVHEEDEEGEDADTDSDNSQ